MQETHSQSKEIDITGFLVVTLVVMLGVLFVQLTSNLTKTSVSTSTRASVPADDLLCSGSHPLDLAGPTNQYNTKIQYDSSGDYCPNISLGSKVANGVMQVKQAVGLSNIAYYQHISYHGECEAGYVKDDTTRCGKGKILGCCRQNRLTLDSLTNQNVGQFSLLGDYICNAKYGNNATCAQKCGAGTVQATTAGTKECVYGTAKLYGGICCMPNVQRAPTSFQPQIIATSCLFEDMGVRFDCSKTFANSPGNVGGLQAACVPMRINDVPTHRCGYTVDVAYHGQNCNGQQWVYGIYKEGEGSADTQCYVGNANQPKISLTTGQYAGMDACMLIKSGANSQNGCTAASGTLSDPGQH